MFLILDVMATKPEDLDITIEISIFLSIISAVILLYNA